MFEWKASNAVFLDENTGGKGKYFRARILQAGLVKYSFGVCLLENETINKFIYEFVGCPVIIDHKDITNENAKDERVGVISRVWFDQMDGWFWVEGVIFDEEAISLINDGYNVSCQYEISEYANNVGNQLHNGNPYDKVILNGKPEHLAIVKNPRYENAMIAVNALDATNEKEFRTADDGHVYPLKRAAEYGECHGRKAVLVDELADIEKHYESLAQYDKGDNSSHSRANKFALDVLLGKAKGIIEKLDAMNANDEDGHWITIKGTHVFVKDGQSVEDAMKEHGFDKSSSTEKKEKDQGSDFRFRTNSEYKSKKHPDGIVFDLIGEEELIEGFESASKGQIISKELEDRLSKEMQKYSNLPGWSDKFEQMWNEIDDYHDQWKDAQKSSDKTQEREVDDIEDGEITKHINKIGKPQSIEEIGKALGLKESEYKTSDDKASRLEFRLLSMQRYGQSVIKVDDKFVTKKVHKKMQENDNKATNAIIQAINEIKETDMFGKLFKKKENKMDKDELKSLFMECLSELTAKNEKDEEEKEEDKKAENEEDMKEEDKKDEKEDAENKCKNDIVDKRDIIRQIMAIAGKREDDEDVRTIAKLAEKLAYDKSEADRKADNKCKNEDEEDKKEDDAENKAKNSIEEIVGKMSAGVNEYKPEPYLSQKRAIELGDKLF